MFRAASFCKFSKSNITFPSKSPQTSSLRLSHSSGRLEAAKKGERGGPNAEHRPRFESAFPPSFIFGSKKSTAIRALHTRPITQGGKKSGSTAAARARRTPPAIDRKQGLRLDETRPHKLAGRQAGRQAGTDINCTAAARATAFHHLREVVDCQMWVWMRIVVYR